MKVLTGFQAPLLCAAAFLLFGCQTVKHEIQESNARTTENQLTAAGFKIMMADTKERQKMLTSLPADTMSHFQRPDDTYYVYPDPVVCSCLYVGRQQEFEKLQKLSVDLANSNRAMISHEISENQQAGFAPSGAWGNMGYWGITNPNSMGRPGYDPE
jgi:hypothetical protein